VCIVRILDAHLPSAGRRAQAVALLQSWIDGKDADDQRTTNVDHLSRFANARLWESVTVDEADDEDGGMVG
jgi:hypothetical protein